MKTAIIIEHDDRLDRHQVEALVAENLKNDDSDFKVAKTEPCSEQYRKLKNATNDNVIGVFWDVEDVRGQAKGKLNEEEAMEVLLEARNRHDASIGICWDVLDIYIDDYVRERDQ